MTNRPETPDDNELPLSMQRALSLATGGIFDHVAGGFHRYTEDASWTVPHFEKTLYDNGLILAVLAECQQTQGQSETQLPAVARAVEKTVAWLKREMRSPDGYFYAAQAANSFTDETAVEPEAGAFYVWSYAELEKLLSPNELVEMKDLFGVSEVGNFQGKNVLQRTGSDSLSESAEAALDRLFRFRYGAKSEDVELYEPAIDAQMAKAKIWPGRRIPPVTDTRMIVAWNALMISGLAKAAVAFERKEYLVIAMEAAGYIQQYQQVDGTLYRINHNGSVAVSAQTEDYPLLIKALLDIQQACLWFKAFRKMADDWSDAAIALQAQFDEQIDG